MAKRKIDSGLDDIVVEYLKKVKCEKSTKMFRAERSIESGHSKSLKKFMKFLKQKEIKKENLVEDDLGFKINFGAFEPEQKVSFRAQNVFDPFLVISDLRESGHYLFQ